MFEIVTRCKDQPPEIVPRKKELVSRLCDRIESELLSCACDYRPGSYDIGFLHGYLLTASQIAELKTAISERADATFVETIPEQGNLHLKNTIFVVIAPKPGSSAYPEENAAEPKRYYFVTIGTIGFIPGNIRQGSVIYVFNLNRLLKTPIAILYAMSNAVSRVYASENN
jgi:hypothetical protein